MIARVWKGKTLENKSDEYLKYLEETGLKDYCSIPGNLGVQVLIRSENEITEFTLVSFWDSYESIIRFAGNDYNKARYYPVDKEFLLSMESEVFHYKVKTYSAKSSCCQPCC